MMNYKVGDWVGTFRLMPGIVREINEDSILIFYPDKAIKSPGKYSGEILSFEECPIIHKISSFIAVALLSIGEKRLKELYDSEDPRDWSDLIEDEFEDISKLSKI